MDNHYHMVIETPQCNNQEETGKMFGADYSTVSQNRKRLKLKLEKDLRLRKAFNKIGERLDKMSK